MLGNMETQKLIKKMLNKHKKMSKALRYELVAEQLGVTPRYVRYLEAGRPVKVKAIEKLIRIMA